MSKKPYIRPLDLKHGVIDMNHGAGGRASKQLIDELFAKYFHNPYLGQGDDGARLPSLGEGEQLVMSTDAHVVQPLFFAGGDIGTLAVNGTVNDLAMMGAKPLYLTCSFIIEAGFALADLQKIIQSMATSANIANVVIVAGDTKVVERGKADGVFISTTGVGAVTAKHQPSGRNAEVGDVVILSGSIADHGMAVLSQRESLAFDSAIESDCASLAQVVGELCDALPSGAIKVLRDPTRGGLATTLNEIAEQSQVGMRLQESAIVIHPQVYGACELLGLDPLYIANEGKFIAIVSPAYQELALATLRANPLTQQASVIGEVVADPNHFIQMQTQIGGLRMVDWLSGEPLPRIC
ncbi:MULTISPECIES: hydrogenase expression/formation protein HypE [unclassified Moraxella]|uniref:hydrogenase expression/formation protein HypE n=1 Tax=unclassified Moraxella TaxID=2685852 RepID=UPI003AF69A09